MKRKHYPGQRSPKNCISFLKILQFLISWPTKTSDERRATAELGPLAQRYKVQAEEM
jgi:hypothetical protein